MAVEQANQRLKVFVSYSRVDSEFAYRLRADLEASGFGTWIDTAKLGSEGGQEWLRIIQDAIDSCQAMVVVISPDSVQSKYVHMEYHRAQTQHKLVIPLHFRTVSNAPIDLDLDQWIDFRSGNGQDNTYQPGFSDLVRSLSKAPQPPRLAPLPKVPGSPPKALTISEGADIPEFGPVPVAPPQPSQDTQSIIAGVYDARSKGDLPGEQYFLQELLKNPDKSISPQFAERLVVVTKELEQQRLRGLRKVAADAVAEKKWRRALGAWQALLTMLPNDGEAQKGIRLARRERAEEALRDGDYDEAVGSWQALLRLDPEPINAAGLRKALYARADSAWKHADWVRAAESWETLGSLTPPESRAKEYLGAIAQNRREAYRYELAQRFLAADNRPAAQATLDDLYKAAPYYGDPENVAAEAGVAVPKSLQQTIEERIRPIPMPAPPPSRKPVSGTTASLISAASTPATAPASDAPSHGVFIGFMIALFTVPGNFIGSMLAAAIQRGSLFTHTTLGNGFSLIWQGLAAFSVAYAFFALIAAIAYMLSRSPKRRYRHAAAFNSALVLGFPISWLIAYWLYGFKFDVFSWASFGIIAGAGVAGIIAGLSILIVSFILLA